MNKTRLLILGVLAAFVLLIGAACATQARGTTTDTKPGSTGTPVTGVGTVPTGGVPSTGAQSSAGAFPAPSGVIYQQVSGQTGIWVSGRGEVIIKPDMAVLNVGVESRGKTVGEAMSKASEAMNKILQALKARGAQEKDIQTRFFNITPEYVWNDVARRSELTGYIVNNRVTAKLRELDKVGTIIDNVAAAGGDLTRIQGVSFTVENTRALETQARELAVKDALAKAQQFAQLANVKVGKLAFISEASFAVPIIEHAVPVLKGAPGVEVAPTPISGGELTVSVQVQAVFAIE